MVPRSEGRWGQRHPWCTRSGGYLITMLIVLLLNFFLPRLMPGDPFTFLSTGEGEIVAQYSEAQINMYKAYYGLDRPWYEQLGTYFGKLLHGDLGMSIYYHKAVTPFILERIGWTMFLVLTTLILSSLCGTILGSLSAWFSRQRWERMIYLFFVTLSQIPSFLIGILFLFILAARWELFPLAGAMTPYANYASWGEKVWDLMEHAALPILTLTLVHMGRFYLLARSSMVAIIEKAYMRTAFAKGLPQRRRLFRHGLRNAIIPVVNRIFLQVGGLMGGAILVENVFQYPGIGLLMSEAVYVRDYPLIQGIFLFVMLLVMGANLLAEIVQQRIDPRIKGVNSHG